MESPGNGREFPFKRREFEDGFFGFLATHDVLGVAGASEPPATSRVNPVQKGFVEVDSSGLVQGRADDLLSQRPEAFIRSRNAPDASVTITLKKHRFQLSGYCLRNGLALCLS